MVSRPARSLVHLSFTGVNDKWCEWQVVWMTSGMNDDKWYKRQEAQKASVKWLVKWNGTKDIW